MKLNQIPLNNYELSLWAILATFFFFFLSHKNNKLFLFSVNKISLTVLTVQQFEAKQYYRQRRQF